MKPKQIEFPLGKKIKFAMIEQDLTFTDVARRTHWSVSYVSMLVNGRRKNPDALRDVMNTVGIKKENKVTPTRGPELKSVDQCGTQNGLPDPGA